MIQFDYFLLLAEELNFSSTAKKLGISQPSLSAYIRRLEKYFNTPLFIRTPKLALTPAGELVAKYGKKINAIYLRLEQELSSEEAGTPTSFTIGLARPLGSSRKKFVSLNRLNKQFPNCKFSIVEGSYGGTPASPPDLSLKKRLSEGKLDCVICQLSPMEKTEGHFIHLFSAPEYVIISKELREKYFPNGPDTHDNQGVDLLDFAPIPQIAHSVRGVTQLYINNYLTDHGKKGFIHSVINNPLTIYELVAAGTGWARTSWIFFPETISEEIEMFPIFSPPLHFDYYLLTREDIVQSPAQQAILQAIADFILQSFSESRNMYVHTNV